MKKLVVLIMVLAVALSASNALAYARIEPIVGESLSPLGDLITYNVYSEQQNVYALLIGAATPVGNPWGSGNTPGSWVGETLNVYSTTLSAGFAPDNLIFTNLPKGFTGYQTAYLFYDTSNATPIGPNGPSTSGTLYAWATNMASPFVYLTDSSFIPADNLNYDLLLMGAGNGSTVPLPPTVYLLGFGLLGLGAFRRRLK